MNSLIMDDIRDSWNNVPERLINFLIKYANIAGGLPGQSAEVIDMYHCMAVCRSHCHVHIAVCGCHWHSA